MRRITAIVDSAIEQLLAGLMGLAVINVVWQVFSRYVLKSPSAYTEELARFLLIWIGLLGSAYAVGRGMHLAIDLLPQALGAPARRRLDGLIAMLIIFFAITVLIWGGSRLVWMTLYLGQRSAAMRVPLGYVYAAIPVSGLLMIYYAVVRFFEEEP
jgi:TRAP-type C4-dicarboxylate transport system permease small subunit